ncbi:MAG: ribonuclease, partial [Caulobacter sp. 39-67-4]
MSKKMLIDAAHAEETRVVVVDGTRVEEFDFESQTRKQLRGNIYLAKVTRVEPSLQAAFIEYGGNRHGFLAFSEIHPDYYQIPVADRQALIEADERAHREAEEESENRSSRRRSRHRSSRRRGHGDRVQSAVVEGAPLDPSQSGQPSPGGQSFEVQVGDHDSEHHDNHGGEHTHDHDHDDHHHENHAHDDGHHAADAADGHLPVAAAASVAPDGEPAHDHGVEEHGAEGHHDDHDHHHDEEHHEDYHVHEAEAHG